MTDYLFGLVVLDREWETATEDEKMSRLFFFEAPNMLLAMLGGEEEREWWVV